MESLVNIYLDDDQVTGRIYPTPECVKRELTIKKEYWKQGPYRKERVEYDFSFLVKGKNGNIFFRGFLPRIIKILTENKINYKIHNNSGGSINFDVMHPHLKGITFTEFQIRIMEKALKYKRGIILAPTGVGKSLVSLGIMSCLSGTTNILFMAHTRSILDQMISDAKKFGFNVSSGKTVTEKIHFCTNIMMNNLIKKGEIEKDHFDFIIVDEVHHVSAIDTIYADVMIYFNAAHRIGLTATLPDREESLLTIEGLFGPVIDQVEFDEGIQGDLLVKPKITILRVPTAQYIRDMRSYREVYSATLKNKVRNTIIASCANDRISKGKTVLILVREIEHGFTMENMIKGSYFIYGDTEKEIRENMKKSLNDKKIKCIIASTVWLEGINIPSLDVIINADTFKSEKKLLQGIGRGLRKIVDKDTMEYIDVFDNSHHYLINHFGERICVISELGWL